VAGPRKEENVSGADAPAKDKMDKAAERLARREANQAEREARRAANQAERAARKSGRGVEADGAIAAVVAKPSRAFNILIIAQAGRLEREAVLFAASLRRNAPDWQGRLIVAEPLEAEAWEGVETQISDAARTLLGAYGAEIRPFTARHFGKDYPYGNKIEALAVLPESEPFIFFDSDTLVTGPLDRLPIDFARPSASMRRTGTWPAPPLYGPGYGDIWRSLYDRFGLDFASSLDRSQPVEHWERYLYFNAGWFFGADPKEFGRRFLTYALEVNADPGDELACQSLDPWLDQVVLPLVVHGLGGGRPAADLSGLDGDVTCHYRNLSLLYARESDAAMTLAEELIQSPRLADLFAEDEEVSRLVARNEGRQVIRPMFADEWKISEQAIRHRLKREGLWFR